MVIRKTMAVLGVAALIASVPVIAAGQDVSDPLKKRQVQSQVFRTGQGVAAGQEAAASGAFGGLTAGAVAAGVAVATAIAVAVAALSSDASTTTTTTATTR